MSRSTRIVILSLAGILTVAIAARWSWRPLFRQWAINHSKAYFHEQFRPNQDAYVCIPEHIWAWNYFGGTKGIPTLHELSQAPSLAPCGRVLASNLLNHISSGKHLETYNEAGKYAGWFARDYYAYIRDSDLRYLKGKQSQASAGATAVATPGTNSLAQAKQRGETRAKADVAKGTMVILYYGQPWSEGKPLVDDQSQLPVKIVEGCCVTAEFAAETDAYNAVMRQVAKEKREPQTNATPVTGAPR